MSHSESLIPKRLLRRGEVYVANTITGLAFYVGDGKIINLPRDVDGLVHLRAGTDEDGRICLILPEE